MPEAIWVAVITNIGLIVVALVQSQRARVSAAEAKDKAVEARDSSKAVLTTLQETNGGSSVRDALNDTREALRTIGSDLRGMRRDIGRLADIDREDRATAHLHHDAMRLEWQAAINDLRQHLSREEGENP